MEVLYGLHPVEEALRAGKPPLRSRPRSPRAPRRPSCQPWSPNAAMPAFASFRSRATNSPSVAKNPAHQGVVAIVRPQESLTLEDLFAPRPRQARRPSPPRARWRRRPAESRRSSCASPTAQALTASCSPSAAPRPSAPLPSKPAPERPSTCASPASSTSSAPSKTSSGTTSGSSVSTSAAKQTTTNSISPAIFVLVLGREGAGPPRSRPPHLRSPAAHSHGRRRQLAQRLRRRSRCSLRSLASAAPLPSPRSPKGCPTQWCHSSAAPQNKEAERPRFMKLASVDRWGAPVRFRAFGIAQARNAPQRTAQSRLA